MDACPRWDEPLSATQNTRRDPAGRARAAAQDDGGTGSAAGLLISTEHILAVIRLMAVPDPLVQIQHPPGLGRELRIPGKIHDRYRHGRIASASSHRHTVDRDTDSTRPGMRDTITKALRFPSLRLRQSLHRRNYGQNH